MKKVKHSGGTSWWQMSNAMLVYEKKHVSFLRCCLAAENNLSDGVADACTHIYLPDRPERMGKVDPFFHHHLTGSLVMDREGKFL